MHGFVKRASRDDDDVIVALRGRFAHAPAFTFVRRDGHSMEHNDERNTIDAGDIAGLPCTDEHACRAGVRPGREDRSAPQRSQHPATGEGRRDARTHRQPQGRRRTGSETLRDRPEKRAHPGRRARRHCVREPSRTGRCADAARRQRRRRRRWRTDHRRHAPQRGVPHHVRVRAHRRNLDRYGPPRARACTAWRSTTASCTWRR